MKGNIYIYIYSSNIETNNKIFINLYNINKQTHSILYIILYIKAYECLFIIIRFNKECIIFSIHCIKKC